MARIRSIKPDFFTSDTVSALPLRARLTWIGLWTHCDDHGRCRDNVKLVKAAVWALDDVSLRDVTEDLAALETAGVIYRYTGSDAKQYIQITNWTEHQKVDRPSKSTIPAPDELPPPPESRDGLARDREDASDPRGRRGGERNGGEGTRAAARESPPSDRCPNHTDNPDPPPCGPCGDARKARQRFDQAQAQRASQAQAERARQQAEVHRLAVDACPQCDDRGYVGAHICPHDPTAASRARAGAAAARAAIPGGAA
jgi:hypothetical protein